MILGQRRRRLCKVAQLDHDCGKYVTMPCVSGNSRAATLRNSCIRRHISRQLAESPDAEAGGDMLGQGSRYCGTPLLSLAGADHSETHSKRNRGAISCTDPSSAAWLNLDKFGSTAKLVSSRCALPRPCPWWLLLNFCKAVRGRQRHHFTRPKSPACWPAWHLKSWDFQNFQISQWSEYSYLYSYL